jgi:hypothetical protein
MEIQTSSGELAFYKSNPWVLSRAPRRCCMAREQKSISRNKREETNRTGFLDPHVPFQGTWDCKCSEFRFRNQEAYRTPTLRSSNLGRQARSELERGVSSYA